MENICHCKHKSVFCINYSCAEKSVAKYLPLTEDIRKFFKI